MKIVLTIIGLIIAGMLFDIITAHWPLALFVGACVFLYIMHPTMADAAALATTTAFVICAPVILIVGLLLAWPKREM